MKETKAVPIDAAMLPDDASREALGRALPLYLSFYGLPEIP
jgi:hypothetical protein